MSRSGNVLIIDGGHYTITQQKVARLQRKSGSRRPGQYGTEKIASHLIVCPLLFLQHLENQLDLKFDSKYFYQGTADGNKNKFHYSLMELPPKGPHMTVVINGMKYQKGKDKDTGQDAQVLVEKGVDVQIATKLIECAYGLNGEQKAQRIFVITGDGDFLPAFSCARVAPEIGNNVHVISSKGALSKDLNIYCHISDNAPTNLENIMEKSLRSPDAPVATPNSTAGYNHLAKTEQPRSASCSSYHPQTQRNSSSSSAGQTVRGSIPAPYSTTSAGADLPPPAPAPFSTTGQSSALATHLTTTAVPCGRNKYDDGVYDQPDYHYNPKDFETSSDEYNPDDFGSTFEENLKISSAISFYEDGKPPTWSCKQCTYDNKLHLKRCSICDEPRT